MYVLHNRTIGNPETPDLFDNNALRAGTDEWSRTQYTKKETNRGSGVDVGQILIVEDHRFVSSTRRLSWSIKICCSVHCHGTR